MSHPPFEGAARADGAVRVVRVPGSRLLLPRCPVFGVSSRSGVLVHRWRGLRRPRVHARFVLPARARLVTRRQKLRGGDLLRCVLPQAQQ